MSSTNGGGAATASRRVVATGGMVLAAILAGSVASFALVAGGTAVARNVTQPNATSVNLNDVNQPRYADE